MLEDGDVGVAVAAGVVLGAVSGSEHRAAAPVHNGSLYATSSFTTVAPRLYDMAGVGPSEVEVVQSYENFTGGVVMALIEHGFCSYEEANEFLTFENLIAPAFNATGVGIARRADGTLFYTQVYVTFPR